MTTAAPSRQIEAAKTYFRELDGGRLPEELFTEDLEFFFPKFGVGSGLSEFRDFATGLYGAGYTSTHHRDQLRYLQSGRTVVVEGTTFGKDGDGRNWNGGETPGGRFCSVFEFADSGLIQRMYIYLDPDFTSQDTARFHWRRTREHW